LTGVLFGLILLFQPLSFFFTPDPLLLVEAQQIRNSKTDFNKAVMAIDAKHKWTLTGTPFVNKPSVSFDIFETCFP
jgi:SNF2-related domain